MIGGEVERLEVAQAAKLSGNAASERIVIQGQVFQIAQVAQRDWNLPRQGVAGEMEICQIAQVAQFTRNRAAELVGKEG